MNRPRSWSPSHKSALVERCFAVLRHRRNVKNDAHGLAASVPNVTDCAAILEWCRLPACQLGFAHKHVHGNSLLLVLDDRSPALIIGSRLILTLPVKRSLIDPMIDIAVILGLPLFADRYEQHMYLPFVQNDMASMPIPRIELLPEQRRYFFTLKKLPDSKLQWIENGF